MLYRLQLPNFAGDLAESVDQLGFHHVRGHTAGFNTPHFVVDAMGGGGKRDVHSFEHYNRKSGVAVFTSPAVKPGKKFLYFDPIASLDAEHQWRWTHPCERRAMIDDALESC